MRVPAAAISGPARAGMITATDRRRDARTARVCLGLAFRANISKVAPPRLILKLRSKQRKPSYGSTRARFLAFVVVPWHLRCISSSMKTTQRGEALLGRLDRVLATDVAENVPGGLPHSLAG